jgi:hypothetical protein
MINLKLPNDISNNQQVLSFFKQLLDIIDKIQTENKDLKNKVNKLETKGS